MITPLVRTNTLRMDILYFIKLEYEKRYILGILQYVLIILFLNYLSLTLMI